MAEVEWDHEDYFRSCVLSHSIGRRLPIWPQLPAKHTIRLSYETEKGSELLPTTPLIIQPATPGG
jgi:hypothetical protein